MNLSGSMCALVTPFRHGKIDAEALERLIEFQIENGTSALIPCGTTGESATLSHEEHREVIGLFIRFARGRVPIIAGSGSNSTSEAIWLTQAAKEWGADAALLITPYYNKPTQEGLYAHYRAVADAVAIPQILYNVPSRTAVSISPETAARLAEHPNIVAIKEASGSMDYVSRLRSLCDLTILSGNDNLTLPLMALGARGAISVLANVVPRLCADMMAAVERNDWETARAIHYKTFGLTEALFCETNPIPVKAALHMMGLISPEIRLPLTPISEAGAARLRRELVRLGLLTGQPAEV
ncbi:MAG: 4-hydroxy-tetrahydrodipicolinate synthase [Candidatus Sumerlaeaceae bacterium]|nr:4-hydroxy-tetrahydrodipicolinate synthase [Candidatus Sumerlaeaceae bacterium]